MILFFGGSFDPIHVGHLIVARDLFEHLLPEKIVFIPTFQAPLKEKHRASPEDRFNMVKLAIRHFPFFEVSSIEIDRGGISYTVDTARELLKLTGEKPFFIVGADSILQLHLWKDYRQLIDMARFVVVDRDGKGKEVKNYLMENFPMLKEDQDYIMLSIRRIDVSSTEIRNRIKRGLSIKWFVPEEVEDYIIKRGLYR
ncbi:nicotinate-nucleotide adenylyltransferase [Thermocrinis minervae]|uniref:Probable nicotinate-nucleotide adenylyltransferase n=1 Tax=Thermocrinis minervae TaxID=381751 RepID=A0A1M6R9U2_9AQUI|nr:nicotinate-nucleotide adenylyltransferase [Thermocrinis minervae]SHK29196.1 nicotinate-nucleotide adenylyltransferase [Thermocrinis minervae]